MESALGYQTAKALLEWQIELGADEAIGEMPVNRFDLEPNRPKSPVAEPGPETTADAPGAIAAARQAASGANDLAALHQALISFDHCDLKQGARSTVFSDGNPASRVMLIGEAPGRDEDQQGRPFVGRAGQLLDRMLAAIDLSREAADSANSVYITNILPWRPPQNRDPKPEEIAMLMPFVKRHVELVKPDVLVLMGNNSCLAVLGTKGITRLRGKWTNALGVPTLPMFHPAYLLRNPAAKKEAWHDLLDLQARLRENP